ncbi:MAG: hypothetical protein SNJ72_02050, partial [Fimbriimonadales bacterium]
PPAPAPVSLVERPEIELGGTTPTLTLQIQLPEGYKLNAQARSQVRIVLTGATVEGKREIVYDLKQPTLAIPLQLEAERATLELHLLVYYCQAGQEALCYLHESHWRQPILRSEGKPSAITLNLPIRSSQ